MVRDKGVISIAYVVQGYRYIEIPDIQEAGFGESGPCQVNINCPEGNNWQNEKKAVALILVNGNRYCTGSLVNNTAGDNTPYLLTADHCLEGWANPSKLDAISNPNANYWSFYWNYESPGCTNTYNPPGTSTSGATVVANNKTSDFALLRLAEDPRSKAGVNPYYLGWDRSGNTGSGGVGIHHPNGDVKKIATYTMAPSSNGNFWQLYWSSTASGHSVTEGGSSGSSLLNNSRKVIGQLYGGSSVNCSDPANDLAMYGKLSVSWTGAGASDKRRRLRDWLDPLNTGISTLNGLSGCFSGSITGPEVFCTNSSFQVNNLPAGATASWSVTSGLQIVGSAIGSSVTIKVIGNGIQYVKLDVVTSCGTQKITKQVNVGIPAITVTTYDDRTPQYSNYTYHSAYAELLPGTTSGNYKWYESVNGQFTKLIATGTSLHQWPIPPCTSKTYRLEVTTPCGIAYWNGYAYNTNCNSTYTAYPNPASDELIIENVREGEANEQTGGISASNSNEEEIGIKLYNQFGEVVLSEKSKKAKTTLNTKALKDGLYYLHITDKKGETSKQQIQINH